MKKILCLMLAALLLASASCAVAEVSVKNVMVIYNGENLIQFNDINGQKTDVLDVDGQIYVPLEALVLALGGEYTYLPEANLVTFSLPVSAVEALPATTEAPAPALPSPVGKWHADLANTTADLNLLQDGTAHLTIMSLPFSCTWELDGETFKLYQNKQVFEGKYDGESIVVDFSVYHLELKRK